MKSFSHGNLNFKFNCLHFTTLTISLEASSTSYILRHTGSFFPILVLQMQMIMP